MQVDVVGPHYTSDSMLDHKLLLPLLMDAIFKFHKCGFQTVAVVCASASHNLTLVKDNDWYMYIELKLHNIVTPNMFGYTFSRASMTVSGGDKKGAKM